MCVWRGGWGLVYYSKEHISFSSFFFWVSLGWHQIVKVLLKGCGTLIEFLYLRHLTRNNFFVSKWHSLVQTLPAFMITHAVIRQSGLFLQFLPCISLSICPINANLDIINILKINLVIFIAEIWKKLPAFPFQMIVTDFKNVIIKWAYS